MNERKSQDFISVDSFSQLPFIRRQIKPPPPTPPSKSPNIRLFGFNFPSTADDHPPTAAAATSGTTDNGRKFECHYCCRTFPTSQALGGHQNAHKRERQQAKRAHLYGAVGYHRLSIPAAPATSFPFSHPAPARFYPSWNMTATPAGLGSATQPIIGSPLQDMWRIPAAVAGREVGFSCTDSSSSSSTSPIKESVCDLKDGVSLDLHL
ncbi:zinc finger protein 8-like [Dendrobium catenatum]|uniref:Zinc finger protein 6 n=1 Tax=Dendrobium catenatum TaxID=906689 RepID=A0A2I0WQG3_9ASPA|nr:zinc finger protein 8-like [Dendrobium catenatum]PKU77898.1 Zinc finger protein 6 [Dendrobium catenatum]